MPSIRGIIRVRKLKNQNFGHIVTSSGQFMHKTQSLFLFPVAMIVLGAYYSDEDKVWVLVYSKITEGYFSQKYNSLPNLSKSEMLLAKKYTID